MKFKNLQAILLFVLLTQTNSALAGLIAHYSFDDNLNDSASSNVATAFGAVDYVAGVSGSAINLDNGPSSSFFYVNEYLQLQNMTLGNAFTLSHWVRFDSTAHTGGHAAASFSAGRSGTGETTRALVLQSGEVGATISSNGTGGGTAYTSINDGEFHHVAMTIGLGLISSYVDGVLANTASFSGSVNMTNTETFVGLHRWIDGGNRQSSRFDGAIDELMIFDEALSANEIGALASVPEPTSIFLLALGILGLRLRRNN